MFAEQYLANKQKQALSQASSNYQRQPLLEQLQPLAEKKQESRNHWQALAVQTTTLLTLTAD